jgi:hypothetical protein
MSQSHNQRHAKEACSFHLMANQLDSSALTILTDMEKVLQREISAFNSPKW